MEGQLGKRGRPRKQDRERYASGRAKPEKPTIAPTLVRRAMDHALELGGKEEIGTELGRLGLLGVLTPTEVAAGFKTSELYGGRDFYCGCRRSSKSPSYETGLCGHSTVYGSDEDNEAELNAIYAFKSMPIQQPGFSPRKRAIIERLCVQNESLTWDELRDARILLNLQAEHFGTVKARKSKPSKPTVSKIVRLKKEPMGISKIIPIANSRDEAWLYVAKQMSPGIPDDDALYYRRVYHAMNARNEFRQKGKPGGEYPRLAVSNV